MLISGRSASERVGCPDAAGLSTLQMAVRDVPSAFAYAAVSCKFVPWATLRGLKNATEQVHNTYPCASHETVLMSKALAAVIAFWHKREPHLKDITAADDVPALQYVGKVIKGNSSQALASLMNYIHSAETSSAQQIVLVSSNILIVDATAALFVWLIQAFALTGRLTCSGQFQHCTYVAAWDVTESSGMRRRAAGLPGKQMTSTSHVHLTLL